MGCAGSKPDDTVAASSLPPPAAIPTGAQPRKPSLKSSNSFSGAPSSAPLAAASSAAGSLKTKVSFKAAIQQQLAVQKFEQAGESYRAGQAHAHRQPHPSHIIYGACLVTPA